MKMISKFLFDINFKKPNISCYYVLSEEPDSTPSVDNIHTLGYLKDLDQA